MTQKARKSNVSPLRNSIIQTIKWKYVFLVQGTLELRVVEMVRARRKEVEVSLQSSFNVIGYEPLSYCKDFDSYFEEFRDTLQDFEEL